MARSPGHGKQPARDEIYSPMARSFHWSTVALLVVQVPIGFAMVYRGATLKIWDGLTNALYSTHKLVGFLLLILVVARVLYRFIHGAPADEKSLESWQKIGSYVVHIALYALLLLVPILGWVGVQRFGALDAFGVVTLPSFLGQNQAAADRAFFLHRLAALALLAVIAAHIGAALFHHFIRRDGVIRRMWPGRDD